jgi:uncharacterized HAD superfamily protein
MTNADFYKNMLYFDGTVYHYNTETEACNAFMSVLAEEGVPDGYHYTMPITIEKFSHWISVDERRVLDIMLNEMDNQQMGLLSKKKEERSV